MSKLKEILESNRLQGDHFADQEFSDCGIFSVESAMKEYAEFYAKRCLEIAAENALVIKHYDNSTPSYKDDTIGTNDGLVEVYKSSIINIQMPTHE